MKKGLLVLASLATMAYEARRYRNNHPSCEKGVEGKKTVVCIGDSITFGSGVKDNRRKEAWPYALGMLLGDAWQVLNYGVPGAKANATADGAYPKKYLQEAVNAKADVYCVMLGTNDSKPQWQDVAGFEEGLRKILSQLSGRIVLMTVPKAYENEHGVIAYDVDDAFIYRDINPAVRKLAEEFHATLLDVYPYTCGHPEYFPDGVHPGMEGNMALAWLVHDEIIRL